MKTASKPPTQSAVCPSELGTPRVSAYERAESAVRLTGLACANVRSQLGMLATGTKTELAKTSGNTGRKTADWAASGFLTSRPTAAITHDKAAMAKILSQVQDLENAGYEFEAAEASFDLLVKKALGQYRPWSQTVYRFYVASYGQMPRYSEFRTDVEAIGRGVSAKAARQAWRSKRGNSVVDSTGLENLVTAAYSGACGIS